MEPLSRELSPSRGDLKTMYSKSLLRGLCSVMIVVGISACSGGSGTGATLPDVEITPIGGGDSISLASLDGPAVINLWATNCAPCRAEIPDFEAVYKQRGAEVEFFGINIGERSERAAEFLADVGATYPQYLDPLGYVTTSLDAAVMPVTIVIDVDGVISTRHLGAMSSAQLEAALDRVAPAP